jgi:hypothetical protein
MALVQVLLILFLAWVFYGDNSPGFYLLVFLASLFWRDPFMEMITGTKLLDATILGFRLGQIIYTTLIVIYFVGTFALLAFILWRAKENLFKKS